MTNRQAPASIRLDIALVDFRPGARVSCNLLAWSAISLAAVIPYLPFLSLPFISDDYVQIYLGRIYGPFSHWPELARDALYRCRATSIVLTHLIDQVFGVDATIHRIASLIIHVINCFLVAAFGRWKKIGWQVSVPAAAFFGICQAHQEAIIWVASLPELLVFLFSLLALLGWFLWLERGSIIWLFLAMGSFLLALLSKESGVLVLPLATVFWWMEARQRRLPKYALAGMALIVLIYWCSIFSARGTHLHFHDGTFSLTAPFPETLAVSGGRLLFPEGLAGLVILCWPPRWRSTQIATAIVWLIIGLVPYCFLTYSSRIPSRHTYFASVGLALIMGMAFAKLRLNAGNRAAAALAIALAVHSGAYLWTRKLEQYRRRAEPTERFLQFARQSSAPIQIRCSPYGYQTYQYAAHLMLGWRPERVLAPDDFRTDSETRIFRDNSKP